MGFYIKKVNVFTCDLCGVTAEFILSRNSDVRKEGWAISKDYKKCYCPNCKPKVTSVGAYGGVAYWRR